MLSFYTSVPKIMICYTVPEIWCVTDVIAIFHFVLFFTLLPPNFLKKKKRPEISSFYTSVAKIMIIGYTLPKIWYMTDVFVILFWAISIFLPFYSFPC